MKSIKVVLGLVVSVFLVVPTISAQNIKVSGHASYVPGHSNVVELADGRSLSHSTLRTVIVEDNPSNIQHLMSQDCSGVDLLAADGTPIQIGGSCTGIDADGDILRISYLNTVGKGTWKYAGGTGKFSGAKGGGTSEVIAVGPDGRFTLTYSGELILPGSK